MIKKKCNAYKNIKKSIAKLTIIQQATGLSPLRLVNIFLKYKINSEEKMNADELASDSAYKYFKRETSVYLKKHKSDRSYQMMLDLIESEYLSKEYFGMDYFEVQQNFRNFEIPLKEFVRDGYIALFPITPEMSKTEVAIRNQKLGKISVHTWIGDITNYDYFQQAPCFMMEDVKKAIQMVELYVLNLLHETQLDIDLMKFSSNQKLQVALKPKLDLPKPKINKI